MHGKFVDAARIIPKTYWVLLGQYNSNGYQGVIAEEDKQNFSLSSRNIIPDEGVSFGGAHEPYRQSERKGKGYYQDYANQSVYRNAELRGNGGKNR